MPWAPRLALLASSLVLSLLLAELLASFLGLRRYGRVFPDAAIDPLPVAGYIELDPELGWVTNRSLPGVNRQGFRDPRDFELDLEAGGVMMLGDSFVWGVGSNRDQTIPRLLEQRLPTGAPVYSVAVPGWGIDQMFVAYRNYRESFSPRHVILVFIDHGVDRVLEARGPVGGPAKPCFQLVDGRLERRRGAGRLEGWSNKLLWRSVVGSNLLRQVYLWSDATPVVRQIFAELAADGERHGFQLTLVRIPLPEGRVRRPPHLRLDRFEGVDRVEYLDLGVAMRNPDRARDELYLEDGHLSPAGNAFVVDRVMASAR